MKTFGELLTKYMHLTGITDAQLAYKIGLSRVTIFRWRRGEVKSPRREHVLKIAKILFRTDEEQNELLLAAGCQPLKHSYLSQSTKQEKYEKIPIPGIPITHPSQFFGQIELLTRIRRAWQQPSALQHVAVIGKKRSGKTSLLKYLQSITQTPSSELRPDQPQGWGNWLPHDFQFVFVDFQLAIMSQPESLLSYILEQLNLEVPEPCDMIRFAFILWKQLDKPTIILMDELGTGLQAPGLDKTFWSSMQVLIGIRKLGFLATVHEPLEKLALNSGKESPFFNIFGHTVRMNPLTESEARNLINSFSVPLREEDINWILQESGGWPASLQILCDELLFTSEKLKQVASSTYLVRSESPKLSVMLQWSNSIDSVLQEYNDVHTTLLEKAINFLDMSNSERCKILVDKIGAMTTTTYEPDVFKLHLDENFPLNLSNCLLYFPPSDLAPHKLLKRLQGDLAFQVTITITFELNQQKVLRSYGENLSTQCVVPNNTELATLLLSEEPIKTFITLLVSQIKITQISPYQISEGVNKNLIFFGRIQILAHIINREPANYLLMGGRQIGKSSVLKYIARHYHNNFKIDCHYLVLTGSRLQPKLAKALQLPIKTDLETLLEELSNVPEGQHRLLLIDEADLFIREEIKNAYPMLSHFRSLSEEGHCYFIFAGFWDLYEAALLNYHSPIRNFGEPTIIGALEAEACRQLATEPMAILGIHYASEELVEQILVKTGQRANLIAIVCDEMLKNLDKTQRVLNQQDVTRALHSQAVQGALFGWQQLSNDEQAARLDRVIVYASIKSGEFDLSDIMKMLEEHDYIYTPEQLNQSLARLKLAFIIRRDKNRYSYCVPLFREMLLEQELEALLKQEFKSIN